MKAKEILAGVLFAGTLFAAPAAMVAQGPPPGAYGPGAGWDAPPSEYRRGFEQDAFRRGLDGARRDFENHRPPNVMNRDEYRDYSGPNRRAYHNAFRRGYDAFWSHQGPGRRY